MSWGWLSEPLAHDFANTVHWRGTTPVDHIATLDGLRGWLQHEPHPLPPVDEPSEALAHELRRLRDAVRAAMTAVADGRLPDPADVEVINDTARRHAMTTLLSASGDSSCLMPTRRGVEPLLGALAQAAIRALGDPEQRSRIAFCAAPGCGGLFDRDRPNQVWCHPHCGARARAERHLQRDR